MIKLSIESIKQAIKAVNFDYSEILDGNHSFSRKKKNSVEQTARFSFSIKPTILNEDSNLRNALICLPLAGTVELEGINKKSKLKGRIEADLIKNREIRYEFRFRGSDRLNYDFVGKKVFSVGSPFKSLKSLSGDIIRVKTGKSISSVNVTRQTPQLKPIFVKIRKSFQQRKTDPIRNRSIHYKKRQEFPS